MAEVPEMETWEIQTKGTVRVWVVDRRAGGYVTRKVSGGGPKRITLSREEREYNEELIPEENAVLNPWRNGMLARVEGGKTVGDLTDDTLREYLAIEGEDVFRDAIETIELELTVRRLLGLAASEGRMWQVMALRDLIDDRYRVGGTQPTVQEMLDDGSLERTRLS